MRDERRRRGLARASKQRRGEKKETVYILGSGQEGRAGKRGKDAESVGMQSRFDLLYRSMQIVIFIGRDETSPTSCCNTLRIDRET